MKTRLIVSTIALLMTIVRGGAVQAQTLVLWHANGATTDVELLTQPLVKFIGDKLLVTSPVLDIEYSAEEIVRFTYKGQNTRISEQKADDLFSQKDGKIIFHGVSAADKIALYKTNGIRVPAHITVSDGDAYLSLYNLPSGIYLLSVDGKTAKFTKQ